MSKLSIRIVKTASILALLIIIIGRYADLTFALGNFLSPFFNDDVVFGLSLFALTTILFPFIILSITIISLILIWKK